MEKHWSVSVNIGANNILNIGDNYLSGWDDVMDYADTVQGCAEHLLDFIGRETEATTDLRTEVSRLTALCDGYRGERDRLNGELQAYRDEETCMCGSPIKTHTISDGHSPVSVMDYRLGQLAEGEQELQAALTRARAEALEEAAEIAESHVCEDCKGLGTLCEEQIAISIRAAKGRTR